MTAGAACSSTDPAASTAPSARWQWWVLGLISLGNFGGYYVYDSVAPVADLLHRQLGFSYIAIGTLNAICSLPSIGMPLVGGVLADRYGPAVVAVWSMAACFAGAVLTAASSEFLALAAGRLLFGAGTGVAFVAMLTGLGRWFAGARAGFAMAIYFSIARVGSYLADLSPQLAKPLYDLGWRPPLVLAAAIAGLSLAATLAYGVIDARVNAPAAGASPQRIDWRALEGVTPAFWYLLGMATIFYAVVFPFRSTFSIEYFQNAKGLSLQAAGIANSWVFFAAIFATPVFGWAAGRVGHKTAMMAVGTLALAVSFLILGATPWSLWITTGLVGLSYSLVPAVLWPAVADLVDVRRLGAAYGLMSILQELGMAVCNVAVGWLNDWGHAGPENPAGYRPMLWFFGVLSLVGFLLIALLWVRERAVARAAGAVSSETGSRPPRLAE